MKKRETKFSGVRFVVVVGVVVVVVVVGLGYLFFIQLGNGANIVINSVFFYNTAQYYTKHYYCYY